MPKQVLSALRESVRKDICINYLPGSRYRSVRDIALLFEVSLQTAHKVIVALELEGWLETRERSGTFVKALPPGDLPTKVDGATLLVCSDNGDPRFNEAFLSGMRRAGDPHGVSLRLWVAYGRDHSTLAFGQDLCEQCRLAGASGVIALAFRNAELAFYHVIQQGIPLVSDVDTASLPILPAVQSDNHRHSREAARRFAEIGKKSVLVAGYWGQGNVRHRSFQDEFVARVPDGKVHFVHLSKDVSPADLYLFFRRFSVESAVFTIDYAANHTVAPYFVTYGISPRDCFMVFDSEQGEFEHPGLPPVPAAAPSLQALGERLAQKLIRRMNTGEWSQPLIERL
jgi:DNA-binding LacI/PurR family transcriptional regulator